MTHVIIEVGWYDALHVGFMLIEVSFIWYILRKNPGQRVVDWMLGKDKR
ncbi:MAG: hypothetical protein O7G84_00880 [Gammaproteobacteria bacterium]|nr:hypothetical protein [Gammaproteobacteria bacterium]